MADHAGAGRLAELAVAVSLATDLGTGQPLEHGLRTCWLSLRAAEALGLDAANRSCVYHVALLRFLGCTSDAAETAALAGGDDIAFNASMAPVLLAGAGESMRHFVRHLAEDQPAHRRVGRVVRALTDPEMGRGACRGTVRLPPGSPRDSACPSRWPRRWPTPTSVGTARATPTHSPERTCRSRCGSSRSPETSRCGRGRTAGRRRPRCCCAGGATATTRRSSMP